MAHQTDPAELVKLADRLAHVATTMQNDDLSEPGSEKRARHIYRYETIQDAVAALRLAAQASPRS